MKIVLDRREKLIYAILFSTKIDFEINIEDYCNVDDRSTFREEIRKIVKKGAISITEDRIIHKDEVVIWKLKIKR
jgi:hypothetical protein